MTEVEADRRLMRLILLIRQTAQEHGIDLCPANPYPTEQEGSDDGN
jgi:hypothetical protein